jgi:hypothetical protein
MCTVSFLPAEDGFHLAMNRDEQLSRRAALPPDIFTRGALRALYPHELSGGTWVGVNEAGLALALINWYSQPQRKPGRIVSRGVVIPALLAAETMTEAGELLASLGVGAMNPFRLIIASSRERSLREWRSSGDALEVVASPWQRAHWFSSSFDEAEANRVRGLTCARAARRSRPASATWLRKLHASHHPSKGAFSICMHRIDACTVSCTELSVGDGAAAMTYSAGPACRRGPRFAKTLRLSPEILCRAA